MDIIIGGELYKQYKQLQSMEKKLYYRVSDGENQYIMELSGAMQYIVGDADNFDENTDSVELPQYTLTPVWMTEEDFKNLPEVD